LTVTRITLTIVLLAALARGDDSTFPHLRDDGIAFFHVSAVPWLADFVRTNDLEVLASNPILSDVWPHAHVIDGVVVSLAERPWLALAGSAILDTDVARMAAAHEDVSRRTETIDGVQVNVLGDAQESRYYFDSGSRTWFTSTEAVCRQMLRTRGAPSAVGRDAADVTRSVEELVHVCPDAWFVIRAAAFLEPMTREQVPALDLVRRLGLPQITCLSGGVRVDADRYRIVVYADFGSAPCPAALSGPASRMPLLSLAGRDLAEAWQWAVDWDSVGDSWVVYYEDRDAVIGASTGLKAVLEPWVVACRDSGRRHLFLARLRDGVDLAAASALLEQDGRLGYCNDRLWTHDGWAASLCGRTVVIAKTPEAVAEFLRLDRGLGADDPWSPLVPAGSVDGVLGCTVDAYPVGLLSGIGRWLADAACLAPLFDRLPLRLGKGEEPMPMVHTGTAHACGFDVSSFLKRDSAEARESWTRDMSHVRDLLRARAYDEAVQVWHERLLPVGRPWSEVCGAGADIALALSRGGRGADAQKLWAETVKASDGHLTAQQRVAVEKLGAQVGYTSGDLDAATSHLQKALGVVREEGSPTHVEMIRIRWTMAVMLLEGGRYGGARSTIGDAVDLYERLPGKRDTTWALFKGLLAYAQYGLADYRGAMETLRGEIAVLTGEAGPSDAEVVRARQNLAAAAIGAGDLSEARRQLDIALNQWKVLKGKGSAEYASASVVAGRLELAEGNTERAIGLFRDAVTALRALESAERRLAQALTELGVALEADGRFGDAEASLKESMTMWNSVPVASQPDVGRCKGELAAVLRELGRAAEANELLAQAREALDGLPEGHPWRQRVYQK